MPIRIPNYDSLFGATETSLPSSPPSLNQSYYEQYDRPRRSPGIRPILHAALIFDPAFVQPPAVEYKLPRVLRVEEVEGAGGEEKGGKDADGKEGREEREVGKSDEESVFQLGVSHRVPAEQRQRTPFDDLMDEIDRDLASAESQSLASDHDEYYSSADDIFEQVPDIRVSDDLMNEIDRDLASVDSSSLLSDHDENDSPTDDIFIPTPTFAITENQLDQAHNGQFAVTEEETELLDYDWSRGRMGVDALYTCRGRASSVGAEGKESEDGGGEVKIGSGRWRRWSV